MRAHVFTARRRNKMTTIEILKNAKAASFQAAMLTEEEKNSVLLKIADKLLNDKEEILSENEKDVMKAKDVVGSVMIDRLTLTDARLDAMAESVKEVCLLSDPVGRVLSETVRPNGLKIQKISVPMGVVAIIFESRPNVALDAAVLCLKSGNACVLRGGKEAYLSVGAIVKSIRRALFEAGLDENMVSQVEDVTREGANELMRARGLVDLLIPRGGAGLIRACVENATVPVIETGTGICHIYVDKDADLEKAIRIAVNAKVSRPSVCNAMESILVHKDVAETFLPMLYQELVVHREGNHPVELRLDERAQAIIPGTKAKEKDFDTEFLDYILAVSVVDDCERALGHIRAHSTGHSESIITENTDTAEKFLKGAGSAAVYVNASTRFTDGGEFGLGCEMGISTQKLHARGPMGLEAMTAYQYRIYGDGQIR
ncbi:MAG: glutamate-5-semialdehyde dehydrogenase [Clostridia bacterium]|nr:glutamate-5-semialdehyde dehydrogenase [Clostridia bacterium]MBQ4620978.1 glutamate-5-semialdehyde dehydrogenase [Clostridia bacterium]